MKPEFNLMKDEVFEYMPILKFVSKDTIEMKNKYVYSLLNKHHSRSLF